VTRGRPKLNHTAAGESIDALADRLSDADEALVVMVKGLARAVDEDPQNAALWREYRAAMSLLREAATPDDSDDGEEDRGSFLRSVQTPMGDTA